MVFRVEQEVSKTLVQDINAKGKLNYVVWILHHKVYSLLLFRLA